ncbi:hypothetical protein SAMN04487895_101763 [Paenibacillus sophorae]|uniref:Uncharacterized protein n=1 Tax=Paenibacillus sophorae TaxID=1333845 RepID=A0A1H8H5L4_9BACL|nr:hypothetical protein [Paenibacillus sophorae]QWU14451.1 hypothetical protein KP014_21320 [Paenibacillus sophorae]SEN51526.1 hypothetical protein SAMN04487895_101763 [Paenibacillus sophorae]
MQTKVQFITNLHEGINIYYVLDQFGRTWHTVASSPSEAKNNIKFGEDALTYKLYTTEKFGESLPQYDFKNLILDILEQMGLQDTYEYEEVVGWDNWECFKFMKRSSLHPCELLLEIQKSNMNFDHCAG